MLRYMRLFVAAAAAVILVPAMAHATTPIDQFRDWAAMKAETDNGPVCYVLTQPQSMEPQGVRRGDVFFYVTMRPNEGVRHEVSVTTGYPYREGSQASVEIGDDTFALVTRDDGAWIDNVAEEERLIEAMKAGTDMIVRGTSQRGTDTTDRYSLLGVTAALERIEEECA